MANETLQTLARDVRERRRALRLTQQELAELSGVSTRFIRNVEQANTAAQLESLLPLLAALGLELTTRLRQPAP